MIFGLVGEGLYFRTRHGSIEGVKVGPFKADGTPMLFPLPNSAGEEVQFMIEGLGSTYTYADTPIF
jgi:hypothetical protein